MRRIVRHVVVAAAVTATLVGTAGPAQAGLTVRALWNMNSLPTMVDSAGGDNNGTTRNVKLYGGAYSFNGTTSYATAPDKPNLDPGAATIRLTARISIAKAPATTRQTFDVVRKGVVTTAGGYYKMEIRRSSTGQAVVACVFKDQNGRRHEAVSTVGIAGKGFVAVSCTKTSAGVTVKVPGQTRTSARTLGPIANSVRVDIGSKGDGTDWFAGRMDFVKIEIG